MPVSHFLSLSLSFWPFERAKEEVRERQKNEKKNIRGRGRKRREILAHRFLFISSLSFLPTITCSYQGGLIFPRTGFDKKTKIPLIKAKPYTEKLISSKVPFL